MREIKFRCWYSGKMIEVGKIEFFDGGRIQVNDELVVHPENIMQFTGLKDKNGVEIYEGDIINCKTASEIQWPHTGVVVYQGSQFSIKVSEECETMYTYFWCNQDFEIIGNIYENPELIK